MVAGEPLRQPEALPRQNHMRKKPYLKPLIILSLCSLAAKAQTGVGERFGAWRGENGGVGENGGLDSRVNSKVSRWDLPPRHQGHEEHVACGDWDA